MNPIAVSTATSTARLVLPALDAWRSSHAIEPEGPHLTRILEQPQLFISSCGAAYDGELLRSHRIVTVVSLTPQVFENIVYPTPQAADIERYRVHSQSPSIGAVYRDLGVHRYLLSLKDDGSASPEEIVASYTLVKQICKQSTGGGILVHCRTGNSQSVGVVGALIAKTKRWSLEQAVREVARYRSVSLDERFAKGLAEAIGVPYEG
jgi:hypothetical protein